MKKNFLKIILPQLLLFISLQAIPQNNDPQVSNVQFSQRSDGSGMVDITYNVTNPGEGMVYITIQSSIDNGFTWDYPILQVTGDVGNVFPGNNKHIIWSFAAEHPNTYNENFRIKVISAISGQPCLDTPTITDNEGNIYNTIQIGNQCWMKENLAYLPSVSPSSLGSYSSAYYYVYGYEGTIVLEAKATNNYQIYGVLYNLPAAITACPVGWHLPSDAEWFTLSTFLGGDNIAGGKMKAVGTAYWSLPNTSADNESGFTGLPGGQKMWGGGFSALGLYAEYWSSTAYNNYPYAMWNRVLYYNSSYIGRGYPNRNEGQSVRCVKN
jgi:uncharacterized protein (TIGR02145 family)